MAKLYTINNRNTLIFKNTFIIIMTNNKSIGYKNLQL